MDVLSPTSVQFYDTESFHHIIVADGKLVSIAKGSTVASNPILPVNVFPYKLDCSGTAGSSISVKCYAVAGVINSGQYSIYSFPSDGSATAVELTGSTMPVIPSDIHGTYNYLFYTVDDANSPSSNSTYSIYQFPKAPQAGDLPVLVDSGLSIRFPFFFAVGSRIYYERGSIDAQGKRLSGNVVNSDEALTNKVVYANSSIAGFIFDGGSLITRTLSGSLFVANGATDITAGLAGATIQAYDFESGNKISDIYALPANSNLQGLFIGGSKLYGANRYYASVYSPYFSPQTQSFAAYYQGDIALMDKTMTPVFHYITNTPSEGDSLSLF
jgi:hypothetical protein